MPFCDSEGLSESTSYTYRWWTSGFLEWLRQKDLRLRQLTPATVDRFMEHLSAKGLRQSEFAHRSQGPTALFALCLWARVVPARFGPSPSLPTLVSAGRPAGRPPMDGCRADDQRRAMARRAGQLRNRAILLLLAVYGLRSGEVRSLRLEDIDWTRRILRVRRGKTARVQEYPLTATMGKALRRYLKAVRPECAHEELFLTLHAPFRRLSAWCALSSDQFLVGALGHRQPEAWAACSASRQCHVFAEQRFLPQSGRGSFGASEPERDSGLCQGGFGGIARGGRFRLWEVCYEAAPGCEAVHHS